MAGEYCERNELIISAGRQTGLSSWPVGGRCVLGTPHEQIAPHLVPR